MANVSDMFKQTCKPRTIPQPPETGTDATQDQNDLVRLIAWQIYSRVPRHAAVEANDVVQAGHLGLLRARQSYRAECAVPFSIYARYRIRGEILDMLRRLDTAPRSLRRWQRAVDSQTRNLSLELQRPPTDEELSETLGVEIVKVRRYRQILASTGKDLDSPQRTDDNFQRRCVESVAASDWMPDFIQERKESFKLLLRSIECLPPRARRVVLLYYRQNLTMKQIGSILRVNESRVSQIHKGALAAISARLQSAGIFSTPGTKTRSAKNSKVVRNKADMFVSGKV